MSARQQVSNYCFFVNVEQTINFMPSSIPYNEENALFIDNSAYKYVSEQAKIVGKKIEQELVGLSIKDATELLDCVRRSVCEKTKVAFD